MLTTENLPRLQQMLKDARVDGWLLYDFRGINSIATSMLDLQGMVTRRVFCWIPAEGEPLAITHAIEQGVWERWPTEWRREVYSSWRKLEAVISAVVKGKKVAMEFMPRKS
jgi:Xaa-Pro dipeptidase